MHKKFKIIWFWIVSFTYIIHSTIKNKEWNMILVDFHFGDYPDGTSIRKQLIAKKTIGEYSIYWQDLSYYKEKNKE